MPPSSPAAILPARTDLLRWPVVGPLLRWRYGRRLLQFGMLVPAVAMIVHGFAGPQLAPKNLATLVTWVHYRGALVLVLLVAGNFFCLACPFTLAREGARRLFAPVLHWPRPLRSKWLALTLFVLVLFAYELFDLWGTPWWTAWLILGYFIAALVVDALFKHAAFCKYVCPIGQFNFVAATVSPLEVRARDLDTCARCTTLDCIKGRRDEAEPTVVLQRGCELALFQPEKTGNLDCTFCLDCVHACPHDNVALTTRLPASELWDDGRRAGVGRLSRRTDLGVLALVFTFGALLNAFGMVSPVYAVQAWLAGVLGTSSEAVVLGVLFGVALVVEPALLLGLAAVGTRRATATREQLLPIVTRYAYALIPLGFGVWVAHYSFHLLTGLWTVVPVTHAVLVDLGLTGLGPPVWGAAGLPAGMVYPLQLGFIGLGALGALLVAFRISERDYPGQARPAFAPWAGLIVLLWLAALWLLSQPMEMRGTFLGS